MRYAIYFTPPRDHPLTHTASAWLGRDAFSGLAIPPGEDRGLAPGELADVTALPRRYGFHATLKAPFRLAEGMSENALLDRLERFCRAEAALTPLPVRIAPMGAFFAIVPAGPDRDLDAFAGRVVAVFDKFRAPLSERDFQRREPGRLTVTQLRNLQNWGYPYVFDEFRFHMSLTGPVEAAERARVEAALRRAFDGVLREPLKIDRLSVFVERKSGDPFEVHTTFALGA